MVSRCMEIPYGEAARWNLNVWTENEVADIEAAQLNQARRRSDRRLRNRLWRPQGARGQDLVLGGDRGGDGG